MAGCVECLKSGKPKSDCIEYITGRCHKKWGEDGVRLITTVSTDTLVGPNDDRVWGMVRVGEGDVVETVVVRRVGV